MTSLCQGEQPVRIVKINNRAELGAEIARYELKDYAEVWLCVKTTHGKDEKEIEIDEVQFPFLGVFLRVFNDNPYGRDDEYLHIAVITKLDAATLLTTATK